MSDTVIQVKGLKKYFGDVKAVDNISFEVEQGELFGFLGINGAGKSTTINMLCTLLPPTKGEVMVCGLRAGRENEQIRKQIGVVYQDHCLDGLLTVKENLFTRGALYEKNSKKLRENISKICQILELTEVYGRRVGKLSGGQKRRCEIARALVNTPKVMFLDEPTTGLDPATRKKVWQCLDRLRREEKMTIFLTTHYMEEAAEADRVVVMNDGQVLLDDNPRAVFSHVKELKRVGLDVPQATELCYELRKAGYDLPEGILYEDECAQAIAQLLEVAG